MDQLDRRTALRWGAVAMAGGLATVHGRLLGRPELRRGAGPVG